MFISLKQPAGTRILSVSPVDVDEGGAAVISGDKHLVLVFQPGTFGLSDQQILFRILVPPQHGQVHIDGRPSLSLAKSLERNKTEEDRKLLHEGYADSFTLQELRTNKVIITECN